MKTMRGPGSFIAVVDNLDKALDALVPIWMLLWGQEQHR